VHGAGGSFLGPLDIREFQEFGKAGERQLHECGIRPSPTLHLERGSSATLREMGLWPGGKVSGWTAGGWFDGDIGDLPRPVDQPRHTFNETPPMSTPSKPRWRILAKKSAAPAREFAFCAERPHQATLSILDLHAVKTLDHGTQIDTEILDVCAELFEAA